MVLWRFLSPTNWWECHAPVSPIDALFQRRFRRSALFCVGPFVHGLTCLVSATRNASPWQTPSQLPVCGPPSPKGATIRLDTSNEVPRAPKPSESTFGRPLTPPYPTTKVVGFGGCRTLTDNPGREIPRHGERFLVGDTKVAAVPDYAAFASAHWDRKTDLDPDLDRKRHGADGVLFLAIEEDHDSTRVKMELVQPRCLAIFTSFNC